MHAHNQCTGQMHTNKKQHEKGVCTHKHAYVHPQTHLTCGIHSQSCQHTPAALHSICTTPLYFHIPRNPACPPCVFQHGVGINPKPINPSQLKIHNSLIAITTPTTTSSQYTPCMGAQHHSLVMQQTTSNHHARYHSNIPLALYVYRNHNRLPLPHAQHAHPPQTHTHYTHTHAHTLQTHTHTWALCTCTVAACTSTLQPLLYLATTT